MQYTLISSKGRIYTFFLKTVAETFQAAYGGTLIDASILEEVCVKEVELV
jgi:hypothetical protein